MSGPSPRRGFSLLELMIAVLIVGILAAVALPRFHTMMLDARRAELPGNVDTIRDAQVAYDAAMDTYVSCGIQPVGTSALNKTARPWPGTAGGFDTLGWRPDGLVRGAYQASASSSGGHGLSFGGSAYTDVRVYGYSDVDDDGNVARYVASPSDGPVLRTGASVR